MVFISHKSDPDHAFALRMAGKLKEAGVSCWLAPESIEAGKDYADEIVKAIRSCEIFLLILTEKQMESKHVRKEVDIALRYDKKIIPIKIGNFLLSDRYEYLFSEVQILSFSSEDDDFTEVVEKCKLGEREVKIVVDRTAGCKLNIIKGGYDENVDYFVKTYPAELDSTVFVLGVDRSTQLDISSSGGALIAVLRYLEREFGIDVPTLQSYLDAAKKEQLGLEKEEWLEFKQSVWVRVPFRTAAGEEKTLVLLLIANSQKGAQFRITNDRDDLVGIDSREVIVEAFNAVARLGDRAKTMFIGAMGTNGLAFPYEVITAEIVNSFIFSNMKSRSPFTLYYSIREEDVFKKNKIKLDEITSYIATVTQFFQAARERRKG